MFLLQSILASTTTQICHLDKITPSARKKNRNSNFKTRNSLKIFRREGGNFFCKTRNSKKIFRREADFFLVSCPCFRSGMHFPNCRMVFKSQKFSRACRRHTGGGSTPWWPLKRMFSPMEIRYDLWGGGLPVTARHCRSTIRATVHAIWSYLANKENFVSLYR